MTFCQFIEQSFAYPTTNFKHSQYVYLFITFVF
jgi:hypothetical protein